MTKVYKEVKVTKTDKELVKTVCDWCGNDIEDHNDVEQCVTSYPRTEIRFSIVTPCYEDSYGDVWEISDLCESCGDKLKHVLVNLGINVQEHDW